LVQQCDVFIDVPHLILDYVYFETTPSMPYQIRRIEELNKVIASVISFICQMNIVLFFNVFFQTSSGNVEAKVMCYFRRRDIPATLLSLADKHQG
jgi:metastasis-associated protein MTA